MKSPKFVIGQLVFANNYRRATKNLQGEWVDGEWEEGIVEEAEYSLKYQRWCYTVKLSRQSSNGKILRLHLPEREVVVGIKSFIPKRGA